MEASWRPMDWSCVLRFIDNLLVRIHFIIVMIRWTGLAPWEFEFHFPGSLTSTFHGTDLSALDGSQLEADGLELRLQVVELRHL